MSNIETFKSEEFGSVRIIEENGKYLFCGSDVAKALGYTNAPDAIRRHCRAIVKRDSPISGKIQPISYIPEGDVYRLITHSKLPSAEKFERWVFDDVLPSIRKHGGNRLRAKLQEMELISKRSKYWFPTQRGAELNIFRVSYFYHRKPDGQIESIPTVKINGKGQIFLVNKLLKEGA